MISKDFVSHAHVDISPATCCWQPLSCCLSESSIIHVACSIERAGFVWCNNCINKCCWQQSWWNLTTPYNMGNNFHSNLKGKRKLTGDIDLQHAARKVVKHNWHVAWQQPLENEHVFFEFLDTKEAAMLVVECQRF